MLISNSTVIAVLFGEDLVMLLCQYVNESLDEVDETGGSHYKDQL